MMIIVIISAVVIINHPDASLWTTLQGVRPCRTLLAVGLCFVSLPSKAALQKIGHRERESLLGIKTEIKGPIPNSPSGPVT